MIVATAGHVDHGKTLLIKALTGIDTDRLPEEKKRNLTIDLGFAYLPLASDHTIGFIDVPGHERFIRNMLCGVAGIDFVLFIVAADDGPMPQTEEHLAILDLLGVSHGAIALTKIDRVSAERVDEVSDAISDLFSETALADAPIFPVSAMTGEGIAALKEHLEQTETNWRPRDATGNFRLAVDRCFNVVGAGLVVTGTAVTGSVGVGDQVRVLPSGLSVRVRGIHAQNKQSDIGRAGQRCALNLAGGDLDKDLIGRGDWVVTGGVPAPARKIDARLRILKSESRPLSHWTPVHVHLAAAETTGRVAVLEERAIQPGETGLVQLVLDHPIGALFGDGLIIRDQSARRTIGGGHVIDIFSPARGRAKPQRLAYLRAMDDPDDVTSLSEALDAAPMGLDLGRFAATRNLTVDDEEALLSLVPMTALKTGSGEVGFARVHWDTIRAAALDALAAWHRRSPDTVGPTEDRILSGSEIRLPREIAAAVATELVGEGAIVKDGVAVRLPSHQPALKSGDAALWKKIVPVIEDGGLRPPVISEIADTIGEDRRRLESLLVRAGRQGLVVRVSKNRFFPPAVLRRLGEIAEEVADQDDQGLITARAFRDHSDIGRNLTIEVLEFFDRVKFTRRIGDTREILRPAGDAFGDPSR